MNTAGRSLGSVVAKVWLIFNQKIKENEPYLLHLFPCLHLASIYSSDGSRDNCKRCRRRKKKHSSSEKSNGHANGHANLVELEEGPVCNGHTEKEKAADCNVEFTDEIHL